MADEQQPLPGTKRANDQAERFRATIEKIRSRTDLTAKVLATIGTAAVTAIGYAKLADVFPYGGPLWALFGLGAGLLGMVAAVTFLVRRFATASQTVATTFDPETTIAANDFNESEKEIVRSSYRRLGNLNGTESMSAYQARAHRFERIADRLGSGSEQLRARADQIMSEVLATQARTGAFILRARANRAVFGPGTWLLVGLFVVGWYATAISADALESRRSGEISVAKSCAEARELSAVEDELPTICGVPGDEPDQASAAKAARDGVAAIVSARNECRDKAEEAEVDASVCLPLERALAASNDQASP